jgi:flagellar basal-body rod protein FlgB
MPINLENPFGMHEQALLLRSQRSQLLASNIANADTPGFKARDLDFQAALGHAQSDNQPVLLQTTQTGHLGVDAKQAVISADMRYRVPTQPSLDGNTVDMQQEQAAFAENAVHYQATLDFISNRINMLRLAITGGGN